MMLLLPPPFGPAITQMTGRGSAATAFHAAAMCPSQFVRRRGKCGLHGSSESGTLHPRHQAVKLLGQPVDDLRGGRVEGLVLLDGNQYRRRTALALDDHAACTREVQVSAHVLLEVRRAGAHRFGHTAYSFQCLLWMI